MRTHKSFIALLIFLHCTGYVFAAAGSAGANARRELLKAKVNCLFVPSNAESYILAGTDKAIYRASDDNSPFLPVL